MKKFEYKVFNISEALAPEAQKSNKTWIDVLNKHGNLGWEVVEKLARNSFLMIREISPELMCIESVADESEHTSIS